MPGSVEPTAADLVNGALAGERRSWEELVGRYRNVAWKAIAGFDLAGEDRNDAFAATFFRLFERLSSVREPEKLPGWIATTARHEALALLRARDRERPTDRATDVPASGPDADEGLVEGELRTAVRQAFGQLPAECRDLLQLLTTEPPLSYDEIAALTGRPRGSIGPSRQRCLDRLRRSPALRPFLEGMAP